MDLSTQSASAHEISSQLLQELSTLQFGFNSMQRRAAEALGRLSAGYNDPRSCSLNMDVDHPERNPVQQSEKTEKAGQLEACGSSELLETWFLTIRVQQQLIAAKPKCPETWCPTVPRQQQLGV